MSILAVGTVAFDSIETPFGSADEVLGGSATYIALAARHFTQDVRLAGVVGRDFPDAYRQTLEERGIDLRGLETDEEGETFFWAGRYHYDMNERDTLETRLGVIAGFEPTLPEAYRDSRIVCLGNLDPAIQRAALDQVEAPDFVICDTMNYWIEHTPESLRETLARVDCLVINDAEARELSGEPNLVKAAALIRAMGPEALIIKKGEHGALLFTEEAVFSAPAYPLEEIHDPTGAGDTFAGGLAGHLCSVIEHQSKAQARAALVDAATLKRGIIYGSALASFCVERFGPERLLDLSEEAIHERAMAFRRLSLIPELEPTYSA